MCRASPIASLVITLAVLRPQAAETGPVRISFLTNESVLRDTCELLEKVGTEQTAIQSFSNIVEQSNLLPLRLDLSWFPPESEGSYAFASMPTLVRSLRQKLFELDRAPEFNCFDTAILLSADPRDYPPSCRKSFGRFVISHPLRFSRRFTTAATADEAFELMYPWYYQEATLRAFPPSFRSARVCLTAELFQWRLLPQTIDDGALAESLLATIRSRWKRQNLKFGSGVELVLCHQAILSQPAFRTTHAGVLIRVGKGYTYLEKAGMTGPFVRLDLPNRADLHAWLASLYSGLEEPPFHLFATFNDRSIVPL
jgi:hypothetical protein